MSPASDDLTVDGPDCGMTEAAPWLALAAGMSVGFVLTAGWVVRTAWTLAGDVQARHFLGLP